MRACFADDTEIPSRCAIDIDEVYNCQYANDGVKKTECDHWQPGRAIKLALDILGVPDGTRCGRCNIVAADKLVQAGHCDRRCFVPPDSPLQCATCEGLPR